jgi:hypothetical protein
MNMTKEELRKRLSTYRRKVFFNLLLFFMSIIVANIAYRSYINEDTPSIDTVMFAIVAGAVGMLAGSMFFVLEKILIEFLMDKDQNNS